MRIEAEEYVKNYKLLWDIVEEMTLLNFELLKSKKPQPQKCESPANTTTLNSFKKDHKAHITGLELGLETSLNFAEKLKRLKILGFHFLLNVVVLKFYKI